MVDEIAETNDNKAAADAIDRARLARERREAEQRKRLDELRAHAAAAQAQREKREEERKKRQAEQRARDDDRRTQVEERKRAIWEASVSRREALLAREREREERLERSRAARSTPRSAFAFGSSTPRLLEPVDTAGFFWAARRAASTTNVMFASAPLTRRASALHLDCENENKDEPERSPQQQSSWTSVARRRTDLVPTIPASRPGPEGRSGDSTPMSRPGSALSVAPRRPHTAPRPRPLSVHAEPMYTTQRSYGEGQHRDETRTPQGSEPSSVSVTPAVSRGTSSSNMRRPRPLSLHAPPINIEVKSPAEGKPPIQRKPKMTKEERKSRGKSLSVSPGRSARASKETSVENDLHTKSAGSGETQVSATEVTSKLHQLQVNSDNEQEETSTPVEETNESKPQQQVSEALETTQTVAVNVEQKIEGAEKDFEMKKVVEKVEIRVEKREPSAEKIETEKKMEEKKEDGQKTEDDMTASSAGRRITTEQEAKAALAERRRRAREDAERRAKEEADRLERERAEEEEAARREEERARRDEEEARELAALQRRLQEEKLQRAIEAQQQLEKEEAERKAREEAEKLARIKEEEEKRKALEEELRLKRIEAEKEEKERLARKQRVEAIMARTRLKKAEEDKKAQEAKQSSIPPATAAVEQTVLNNGNSHTADLLGLNTNNTHSEAVAAPALNNGNNVTDLLGLSEQHNNEDKADQQAPIKVPSDIPNSNGNVQQNVSANFIQAERLSEQANNEQQPRNDVQTFDDDFTTHNGHPLNHPLTLQNAI